EAIDPVVSSMRDIDAVDFATLVVAHGDLRPACPRPRHLSGAGLPGHVHAHVAVVASVADDDVGGSGEGGDHRRLPGAVDPRGFIDATAQVGRNVETVDSLVVPRPDAAVVHLAIA